MKFLWLNDMEYFIHKRWKFLGLLLGFPIIMMLILANTNLSSMELINAALGTRTKIPDGAVLEMCIYIFEVAMSLFFIVDIYSKDIEYHLENIFLRFSPAKWYVLKSILFLTLMVLIKVIQYGIVIILCICFKKVPILNDFTQLFLKDIIYFLFLQFLFFSIYSFCLLLWNNRFLSILLFLILFLFLPQNIYELNYKTICFLQIGIIVINFILLYMFKRYNKKMIEREELI